MKTKALIILAASISGLTFAGCTGQLSSLSSDSAVLSQNSQAPTTPAPVATPVASPVPVVANLHMSLPGTNLSGAEYNLGNQNVCANVTLRINNTGCIYQGWDYVYPSHAELDYYAGKGMKIVRVPFDGNRLQPMRNGPLSTTELAFIDDIVSYASTKGLMVLIDPHNFGYLNEYDASGTLGSRLIGVDPLLPASKFADLWAKIATHYLTSTNVIFGLMNEPNAQTAQQWHDVAVVAVQAIRATGATQKIFVQGTSWTGAHSWISSGNAAAWAGFTDTNFAYEVHQYLDSDSSGSHTDCVVGSGSSVLNAFTTWARANHAQGFLGEIGWSTNAVCSTEGTALMANMNASLDVWLGYSYWAGGPWLGTYMYTLEPTGLGTATVVDQPQMSILKNAF